MMCTQDRHQMFKADRGLYESMTVFLGWQEDIDDEPFEIRCCRDCGSSLSDGTRATRTVTRAA